MQNLIITIISIVLVILTTASGAYYLSDAFNNNKVKGESARYINESSQVLGAITTYESMGNNIDSSFTLDVLVEEDYLNHIPGGWEEYPNMIGTPIQGSLSFQESVCIESNESAGFDFIPDGVNYKGSEEDSAIGIPYCLPALSTAVPCCIYQG